MKRKALIVLGMHRSGTSALAGLLTSLGCDGPATPMQAAEENSKGFFESEPLFRLHDALLASAGTTWLDYRPFPASWLNSPKADEFRDRLRETVEAEYGTSGFFVVKDPRICRFLPLWIDLLEEMGVQPIAVHTHRNPLEVAESLHARNGFALEYGHLLWLRHMLDAEAASRALPRAFTSYDLLLDNWAGVAQGLGEQLEISWPRFSPVNASALNAFVEPGLKHHRISPDVVLRNQLLSGWIRDSYAIFQGWAETGEKPEDYARLDAIRQALDESATALGTLVHPQGASLIAERDAARAEVARIEPQLAEHTKAMEALTAERDAARSKQAELEASIAARIKDREALVADRDAVRARLSELEPRLAERAKTIEALTAERDTLQAELARTSNMLVQRKAEIEDAAAELSRSQDALAKMAAQKTDLEQQLQAKAEKISQLDAAGARRDDELTNISMAIQRYQSSLEEVEAKLAERSRMAEAVAADRDGLRAELASARNMLEQGKAKLTGTEEALARMTGLRADLDRQLKKISGETARRDTELSQISAAVLRYQRDLEDTGAQLADQQAENGALRAALAELGAAEGADLAAEVQRLHQEREETQAQLTEATARTEALLNSTSWKLSGPLRWIVLRLRGA